MDSGDTVCTELSAKLGGEKRTPEYHYTCGLIHAIAGSAGKAEAAYKNAIAARPGYWEAHFGLAVLYSSGQRYAEAIDRLKTALQSNPGSPQICREIARVLRQIKDNTLAVSVCEEILAAGTCDPHRHILQHDLGRACYAEGRFADATAAFRDALIQRPLDSQLHVHLGTALLAQGRLDDAADAFELALSLNPDLSSASEILTALRTATGSRGDGPGAATGPGDET